MQTNKMTVAEAMDNWDLPEAAIKETIHYCEIHQELIYEEEDRQVLENADTALKTVPIS